MRTLAAIAVVVCSTLALHAQSAPPNARPADTITQEELRQHVYFLASDFLGGRRPDDGGYTIAAQYAASQFRAAGVRPAFTEADGTPTYFQNVPMMKGTTTIDRPFTLTTPSGEKVIESLDDFRLSNRGPSFSNAPIVFIGYGISEPEYGWDDIKGTDLKGSVAVMLLGTPRRDGKPVLPPAVDAKYRGMRGMGARSSAMRQNTPVAAIALVLDKDDLDAWSNLPNALSSARLQYRPGGGKGHVTTGPPPLMFLKGAHAAAMFAGQEYDPTAIPTRGLDGYRTFALKDVRLSLGIRTAGEDFDSVNVGGRVPGTDPALAHQVITVGAHLDHLAPAAGQIMNGADDNASGSAGVLEIAEAVAAKPLRRSVYFCLWTAEESGLLGSRHFLAAPPVPLDDIIVNLNLDMIGRSDPGAAKTRTHYVVGSAKITPELKAAIIAVNAKTVKWPLDFESKEGAMPGSDHYSFHQNRIPGAFWFSGEHADLHLPGDDAEKIDFEKMQRISQLVYLVTADLGNREKSITPPSTPKTTSGTKNQSGTGFRSQASRGGER